MANGRKPVQIDVGSKIHSHHAQSRAHSILYPSSRRVSRNNFRLAFPENVVQNLGQLIGLLRKQRTRIVVFTL